MKKIQIVKLGVIVSALIFALFGLQNVSRRQFETKANSSGPPPGQTNAPSEGNCAACHNDFPINSGTGNVNLSGLTQNYKPGTQIPITVTVNQADAVIYGFQLTAVDKDGNGAGTFALPGATPPPTMQIIDGFLGTPRRKYVQHTSAGTIPTVFGTRSWTFLWTPPTRRIGKIDFYFSGNAANSDGDTGGDHIYTNSKATLSGSAISNFDGDIKSDIAVFRPSDGHWYSLDSSDGSFKAFPFGTNGDIITPGDFDGDGVDDYAVFRPSNGVWYIQQSTAGFKSKFFGQNGDDPVQGDFDGDLKTDIAVFRPSDGFWHIFRSSNNMSESRQFGLGTDKPVQGDYDADGKTDIAVFRPSNGAWYVSRSSDGAFQAALFGQNGDKPVQSDYDGDGKTDYAVFRPSNGAWYALQTTAGFKGLLWGLGTDTPIPADYDGDGLTDVAVYRDGYWYVLRSSDGGFTSVLFGTPTDVPVPTGYLAN